MRLEQLVLPLKTGWSASRPTQSSGGPRRHLRRGRRLASGRCSGGGGITGAQTMVAYPEPFILRANAVSRAVGELRRCHGVDNVTGTSTQAPAVGRIAQAPSGPGRAMPAKIEGRLHGDWGGLRSSSARDPVAASTGAPLEREPWRCHSIGRGTHGEPPVGGETARLSPPIIRSRFGCQGVGPDAGPERPAWKTV